MNNNISFLTANFNEDTLTKCAISSLNKYCNMPGVIIDNSDKTPIDPALSKYYTIMDNSFHKLIPDYKQGSKNHCASIDYALKNYIKTKYVLLFDCDILFGPNIIQLLNAYEQFDAIGTVRWDDAPPIRLIPYMCIFNVEKMKQENISYFDNDRCIGPNSITYDLCGPNTKNWFYDTGASFYEDIKDTWNINNVDIGKYCVHMKGALNCNRDYRGWLNFYRLLWM